MTGAERDREGAIRDSELVGRIVGFVRRYVVVSPAQSVAIAFWILHTHVVDAAETTPYFHVKSAEKESGKTRLLETCEFLVTRPWRTGRTSTAALVRKIDGEAPTLLLDETDAAFKGNPEYSEVLRGVLNDGYRRGGRSSLVVDRGSKMKVRDFSVFCPKMIAGLGELPDTVASRSVSIELKRRKGTETVSRFRERSVRLEAAPIRAEIEEWTSANLAALTSADPPEEIPGLRDRMADALEPLLAVADRIGGPWPTKAREALKELCGDGAEEDGSPRVILLRDIQTIFKEKGTDRLSSTDLCNALTEVESSPWSAWPREKPIVPAALAKLLKPLRIRPGTKRAGEDTFKGYLRADFEDAWERLLPADSSESPGLAVTPSQPAPALIVTCVGSSVTTALVTTLDSDSHPLPEPLVTNVTARDEGSREKKAGDTPPPAWELAL